VPRLLNIISDRALLGGYSEDRHLITAALVRKAASEVFGRRITPVWLPWLLGAITAAALAGASVLAWSLYTRQDTPAASAAHPAPAPTPGPAAQAPPSATSPPVTTPAAPAAVDLAAVLRGSAAVTDLDGAYARLFALWSARYVAGSEDACSQALRQSLECLNESGGIDSLRRYNRPAILPLEDDTGAVHQAVVSHLTATGAQLLIGAVTHEVALPDLLQRWNGEFLLLWKPPQLDTRSLSMGMRGNPVKMLRARLRQWAGLEQETTSLDVFDDSLQQLVIQFQRRNNLTADGVAGTQTQALLDAALASTDTPLLSAAAL
jgi:general secretion pathway protein A